MNFEGLGEECYRLSICAPFPIFICGNPNSQSDGIWRWGLWEVNEISALIKGTPENSFTPSTMWGPSGKMVIYAPESMPLPDAESFFNLIWNFQPPELRNKSTLFCYSSQNKLRHSPCRPFC